MTEWSIL